MSLAVLNLNGGGIAMMLRNQMLYWQKHGKDIEVALLAEEAGALADLQTTYSNLHLAYTPRAKGASRFKAFFMLVRDVWAWLKENPRDAYFIWGKELLTVVWVCLVFLRRKPKLVMGCNTHTSQHLSNKNLIIRNIFKAFYKIAFKSVDYFTSQTEEMKKDLVDNYSVAELKVEVIAPLVNAKFFDSNIEKIKKKKGEILFVGRLAPEKNLKSLMRAWKLLNQENKEAKLIIAGPGDQAEYLAYAAELGVSESISFIGPQTDLINLYQSAEAVVLSSRYEGFPMVLVEALASGTPVVSYDCPSGPAEVVQNEKNGYLVPLNDETALSAALQKVVTNEWDAEKMRASVMRFHSNHVAKSYTDVIEKM